MRDSGIRYFLNKIVHVVQNHLTFANYMDDMLLTKHLAHLISAVSCLVLLSCLELDVIC